MRVISSSLLLGVVLTACRCVCPGIPAKRACLAVPERAVPSDIDSALRELRHAHSLHTDRAATIMAEGAPETLPLLYAALRTPRFPEEGAVLALSRVPEAQLTVAADLTEMLQSSWESPLTKHRAATALNIIAPDPEASLSELVDRLRRGETGARAPFEERPLNASVLRALVTLGKRAVRPVAGLLDGPRAPAALWVLGEIGVPALAEEARFRRMLEPGAQYRREVLAAVLRIGASSAGLRERARGLAAADSDESVVKLAQSVMSLPTLTEATIHTSPTRRHSSRSGQDASGLAGLALQLVNETSGDRQHAASLLAAAAPASLPILYGALRSPEFSPKWTSTALSLVKANRPEVVGALVSIIEADSESAYAKRHATIALGMIGPDAGDAVPALIALQKSGGPNPNNVLGLPQGDGSLMNALSAIGAPAIPKILTLMDDELYTSFGLGVLSGVTPEALEMASKKLGTLLSSNTATTRRRVLETLVAAGAIPQDLRAQVREVAQHDADARNRELAERALESSTTSLPNEVGR